MEIRKVRRRTWSITVCFTLLLSLAACDAASRRRIRNIRIATRIPNVSVSGTVVSETDQTLQGVIVTAINLLTNVTKSATSGERRDYVISGLRSGEYHVCAELENYGSTCITDDDGWASSTTFQAPPGRAFFLTATAR